MDDILLVLEEEMSVVMARSHLLRGLSAVEREEVDQQALMDICLKCGATPDAYEALRGPESRLDILLAALRLAVHRLEPVKVRHSGTTLALQRNGVSVLAKEE